MFKQKKLSNKLLILSLFSCLLFTSAKSEAYDQCCSPCGHCDGNFPTYSAITYFKLGGNVPSVENWDTPNPALGIGRRYEWDGRAVDISINYAGENHGHYFSIPKILYLQYFTPYSNESAYFGGGLSWGGVKNKCKYQKFDGIFAELAAGMEFERYSPIRTFVEANLSYGILAAYKTRGTPAPALTLAAGVGF